MLGDKRGEALVLNNLGMAFARRRMDEAAGYFEQALAIRREIADLPGEAQTASNLADTYRRLKRYDEALALLKRALEIQRQAANPYSEAVVLNNLGETYLSLGRVTEAVDSLDHAREMFRDIGEIRGEGYALDNLGEAYLSLGRAAPAIGVLERALELRDSAGDRFDAADTLGRLVRAQSPGSNRTGPGRICAGPGCEDSTRSSAVRAQFRGLPRPARSNPAFSDHESRMTWPQQSYSPKWQEPGEYAASALHRMSFFLAPGGQEQERTTMENLRLQMPSRACLRSPSQT